jgi:hypothetical protein
MHYEVRLILKLFLQIAFISYFSFLFSCATSWPVFTNETTVARNMSEIEKRKGADIPCGKKVAVLDYTWWGTPFISGRIMQIMDINTPQVYEESFLLNRDTVNSVFGFGYLSLVTGLTKAGFDVVPDSLIKGSSAYQSFFEYPPYFTDKLHGTPTHIKLFAISKCFLPPDQWDSYRAGIQKNTPGLAGTYSNIIKDLEVDYLLILSGIFKPVSIVPPSLGYEYYFGAYLIGKNSPAECVSLCNSEINSRLRGGQHPPAWVGGDLSIHEEVKRLELNYTDVLPTFRMELTGINSVIIKRLLACTK